MGDTSDENNIIKKCFYDNIVRNYNNFLKKYFGEKTEEFKALLKESKALVAGGSVLAAFMNNTDYEGDIDIYVNVSNAEKLRNFLASFRDDMYISKRNSDNRYAKSFLDINKISRIVRFEFGKTKSIDLVYIKNCKTPMEVVNNFDFTCSQVWFDGDSVTASHPDLNLNKKANINADFSMLYITPDKYAKKRLDKYTAKGFTINNPNVVFVNPKMSTELSNKDTVYHYLFGWTFNYHSFVSGMMKNIFKRCKFNTYTPKNFDSLPKLVKNNLFYFNSDIFDEDDFKSLEDYKNVDMYEQAVHNIKTVYSFIKNELSYLHKRSAQFRVLTEIQLLLNKEFNDIIKDEVENKKSKKSFPSSSVDDNEVYSIKDSDNIYPDIKGNCWVPTSKKEFSLGLFLSDKDNIVIKYNGKFFGYNRSHIIRLVRTNKLINTSRILDDSLNIIIYYKSLDTLDDFIFKCFELTDSGAYSNITHKETVHNVIPYTIKFLKNNSTN